MSAVFRPVVWLFCWAYLAGCAQLSELSSVTINEDMVEDRLGDIASRFADDVQVAGYRIPVTIEELGVRIGPDGSDKVRINTRITGSVSAFGYTQDLQVALDLAGSPSYDSDENAVYLRSVEVYDSSLDAGFLSGNLTALTNEILQLVNMWLADNPVYRLNEERTQERLLMQVPVNLSVQEGGLRLSPSRRQSGGQE